MRSLDEIQDMISTADVGDCDHLLDICQALLDQLKLVTLKIGKHERSIDILSERTER